MDMPANVSPAGLPSEGSITAVTVSSEPFALVRYSRGWTLVPDRCTHSACPFTQNGEIADETILICNCHGSEFDLLTGKVLQGPACMPLDLTRVDSLSDVLKLLSTGSPATRPEVTDRTDDIG